MRPREEARQQQPWHAARQQRLRQDASRNPRNVLQQQSRSNLFKFLRASNTEEEVGQLLASIGDLATTKEWNMAAQAWARAGRPHHTISLLSQMKENGVQPSFVSYQTAMSACLKGGLWEEVLSLFAEMKEAREVRLEIASFNIAISACGKARQWQRALSIFDEISSRYGLVPDVVSYNAAITACTRGGAPERALLLLDEMRAAPVPVAPNLVSFSSAITACVKGQRWDRAISLLREMRLVGVVPDVICYNATISACEKGGQWERALLLLEDMRAAGVAPDVVSTR
jgi:pentatricopeptide repeat domain-containing protein 1